MLYIEGLAAPLTINTMPEGTLNAFADHGEIGPTLSLDGGDCEAVLAEFAKAGVDIDARAAQLQDKGLRREHMKGLRAAFNQVGNDVQTAGNEKRRGLNHERIPIRHRVSV